MVRSKKKLLGRFSDDFLGDDIIYWYLITSSNNKLRRIIYCANNILKKRITKNAENKK